MPQTVLVPFYKEIAYRVGNDQSATISIHKFGPFLDEQVLAMAIRDHEQAMDVIYGYDWRRLDKLPD